MYRFSEFTLNPLIPSASKFRFRTYSAKTSRYLLQLRPHRHCFRLELMTEMGRGDWSELATWRRMWIWIKTFNWLHQSTFELMCYWEPCNTDLYVTKHLGSVRKCTGVTYTCRHWVNFKNCLLHQAWALSIRTIDQQSAMILWRMIVLCFSVEFTHCFRGHS